MASSIRRTGRPDAFVDVRRENGCNEPGWIRTSDHVHYEWRALTAELRARGVPKRRASHATGTADVTTVRAFTMSGSPTNLRPRPCILCRGDRHRVAFVEHGINVVRCMNCGHVSSTFEQDPDYANYWGPGDISDDHRYWFEEAHRAMYRAFTRRFMTGRSGRLLDVGAGLGYFLAAISQEPRWELHGHEISPSAVEYARTTLQLTGIRCGRVQDSGHAPGSIDLITLWDVIEHIPHPHDLLRYLRTLLTPEGQLFLHTPNALVQLPKARLKRMVRGMREGIHYLEARDHVHIYTPATMRMLLTQCGFERIEFHHLPPIQSVSGSRGSLPRLVKRAGFAATALLARASGERLNFDNLFVTCGPSPISRSAE